MSRPDPTCSRYVTRCVQYVPRGALVECRTSNPRNARYVVGSLNRGFQLANWATILLLISKRLGSDVTCRAHQPFEQPTGSFDPPERALDYLVHEDRTLSGSITGTTHRQIPGIEMVNLFRDRPWRNGVVSFCRAPALV